MRRWRDATSILLTMSQLVVIFGIIGGRGVSVAKAETGLVGYFDPSFEFGVMRGWTCDPEYPFDALEVDFWTAGWGLFLGSVMADQPREAAVGAVCGGQSAHGFSFSLPSALYDGAVYEIHAYAL